MIYAKSAHSRYKIPTYVPVNRIENKYPKGNRNNLVHFQGDLSYIYFRKYSKRVYSFIF